MESPLSNEQLQKCLNILAKLDDYSDQLIKSQDDINIKKSQIDALDKQISDKQTKLLELQEAQANADKITNEDLVSRTVACANRENQLDARQANLDAQEQALKDAQSEIEGYRAERDQLMPVLEQRDQDLKQKEAIHAQKEAALVSRETKVEQREKEANIVQGELEAGLEELASRKTALDNQTADLADKQSKNKAWEDSLNDRDVVNTQKAHSLQEISDNLTDREEKVKSREDDVTTREKEYASNLSSLNVAQKRLDLGWLQINNINQTKQLGLDIETLKAASPQS